MKHAKLRETKICFSSPLHVSFHVFKRRTRERTHTRNISSVKYDESCDLSCVCSMHELFYNTSYTTCYITLYKTDYLYKKKHYYRKIPDNICSYSFLSTPPTKTTSSSFLSCENLTSLKNQEDKVAHSFHALLTIKHAIVCTI